MTERQVTRQQEGGQARMRRLAALLGASAMMLAGCGGSGNPADNPATIQNPGGSVSGQKLSFTYFQRCINPIFKKDLQINVNGTLSINKCAGSGCHDSNTGKGGAFRVSEAATDVDPVVAGANTADVIRASAIYKNYYSARGSVAVGAPHDSMLIKKPLTFNVLHGGGIVFLDESDPNVKILEYWINNPVALTDDEFSPNVTNMFTPADPVNGACNS